MLIHSSSLAFHSLGALQGWMAAFAPLEPTDTRLKAHPGLLQINAFLREYEVELSLPLRKFSRADHTLHLPRTPLQKWNSFVDSWIVLAVDDTSVVYEWRLQVANPHESSHLCVISTREG